MADMIPREKRVLDNGYDLAFLDQLLEAVERLKTDPNLAKVCKQMADECHKPAPSVDVEMGEFLYVCRCVCVCVGYGAAMNICVCAVCLTMYFIPIHTQLTTKSIHAILSNHTRTLAIIFTFNLC